MKCELFISEPWEYITTNSDKIVGDIIKVFDKKCFIFKSDNEVTVKDKNIKGSYFIVSTRHANTFFKEKVVAVPVNIAILTVNYYKDITKAFSIRNCIFCFIGSVTADFSKFNVVQNVDERDFWIEYSNNIFTFEELQIYSPGIVKYDSINKIKNSELKNFVKNICKSNNINDCCGLIYGEHTNLSKKFSDNLIFKSILKKYLNKIPSDIKVDPLKKEMDFLTLGKGYIYTFKIMPNGDLFAIIVEIYNELNIKTPFYSIIYIKIDKNTLQNII